MVWVCFATTWPGHLKVFDHKLLEYEPIFENSHGKCVPSVQLLKLVQNWVNGPWWLCNRTVIQSTPVSLHQNGWTRQESWFYRLSLLKPRSQPKWDAVDLKRGCALANAQKPHKNETMLLRIMDQNACTKIHTGNDYFTLLLLKVDLSFHFCFILV